MHKRFALLLGSNVHYPVWNRVMELVGCAAYAGFAIRLAGQLIDMATASSGALSMVALVGLLPLTFGAFLAADFVSGCVHCAADNFGLPTTPFFGVAFIRPFREHHRDPIDITRHDFVETNGNSCIVNLFVLVPTSLALGGEPTPAKLVGAGFALLFTVAIVMTNQIHKWAHMSAPPRLVAGLQRLGLILSPETHVIHHTAPFDKYYCITTGWMNRVLERLGFFQWIVRSLR